MLKRDMKHIVVLLNFNTSFSELNTFRIIATLHRKYLCIGESVNGTQHLVFIIFNGDRGLPNIQ